MKPATHSKRRFENSKLLVINNKSQGRMTHLKSIVNELTENDVLVVNQSGTLPSSFQGIHGSSKTPVEVRLASYQGPGLNVLENWFAIAFGAGSWKTPTEKRKAPPLFSVGDEIEFGPGLAVTVESVDPVFNQLLKIHFQSDSLQHRLYQYGRPIQYSYLEEELDVWDQQTIFSGAPISVEPPSASLNFSWKMIFDLQKKGIEIIPLLHGAGLSSSGSARLDQKFPLAEWYSINQKSAHRLNNALKKGKEIIALGTTVVRALESAFVNGKVQAQSGLTRLKITPSHKLCVAQGLITGMHEPNSSHMALLGSFGSSAKIKHLYELAERQDFLSHEYGDLSLLRRPAA